MSTHIRASALLFTLTLIVCCFAYPVVLWAIGQSVFHDKAEGSLVRAKGPDGVDARCWLAADRSAVHE